MLENQIDAKLVSFSKLGTNFSGSASVAAPSSSSDKAPLLAQEQQQAASSPKEVFGVVSNEIGGLLARWALNAWSNHDNRYIICNVSFTRLAAVNEGMAEYASKQSQSAAIHHTLQRHRDILQDYRLIKD